MSTNIYAEGQLIRVERLQDETLEEQCKRICELKGILELGPFNKTWEEGLMESFYEEYIIIQGTLFEFKNVQEERDRFEMYYAKETPEGYDFSVLFHNGGCCLPEAIEYAVARCEKKKKEE